VNKEKKRGPRTPSPSKQTLKTERWKGGRGRRAKKPKRGGGESAIADADGFGRHVGFGKPDSIAPRDGSHPGDGGRLARVCFGRSRDPTPQGARSSPFSTRWPRGNAPRRRRGGHISRGQARKPNQRHRRFTAGPGPRGHGALGSFWYGRDGKLQKEFYTCWGRPRAGGGRLPTRPHSHDHLKRTRGQFDHPKQRGYRFSLPDGGGAVGLFYFTRSGTAAAQSQI